MFMRLTLTLFICFLVTGIFAQNTAPEYRIGDRFISSAGLAFPRTNHNKQNEQFYGLCYSPSLNLLNKFSDFSFAFGSHISAAYHLKTKSDPSDYMFLSFPAFFEFNAGHLATHNFYSSLGISFGGGYNFSVIKSDFDMGALLITAIHFWLFRQSITLGYTQTYFQNHHTLMHEVSLQLNIGAYLKDARNNNKISKFVKPFRK
ncbi:hypothetical protein BH11BAC1_BH11BAC1_03290 [soil metagenome]